MMNCRTRSKPGFGARLVAEFGLDLIPDLRQLLVAAQLAAGGGGHDFFVRHAEAEVAAEAVLEAEHVVAHDVPAAGFLPEFGGIEGGQQKLLRADGIHFRADDLLDLQQRALGEKEVAVNAGGNLPDVSRAQQKLMAGDLRFGRVFAQRGDEELAPEHNYKGRIQCNNARDDFTLESNCSSVSGAGAGAGGMRDAENRGSSKVVSGTFGTNEGISNARRDHRTRCRWSRGHHQA